MIQAQPKGRYFQNAWVVADLDQAIDAWSRVGGVGPFVRFGEHTLQGVLYRGRPASLTLSGAIAQAGDIQIELIQQTREGPSAYRDTVAAGVSGFHHMGFLAEDFDGEISRYQALGFAIASQGEVRGSRFAYVDTQAALGVMVELLDPTAATRAGFDLIRRLALSWDGVQASVRFQDVA